MLPPDSRAVLTQQLRPPAGYRLESAVATTFTLDLAAALIPALSLSSYAIAAGKPDPVTALGAIRQTVDRLDVYCQAGSVGVPAEAPELAAFLEPMVHLVRAPRGGLFHPKVWLAHFEHEESGPLLRLLVLSRNLTHDISWDMVVGLDAERFDPSPRQQNEPVSAFVRSLPERAVSAVAEARRKRLEALAAMADRAVWSLPDGVDTVGFHFIEQGRTPPAMASRRQLIVSPFINDGGLSRIAGSRSARSAVVSRAEEMEKLSPEAAASIEGYVLDPLLGLEDEEASDGGLEIGRLRGLHAKAYVLEVDGQQKPRVLIGSANATDAAFGSNVEFLVEFTGPRKTFGIDAWLGADGDTEPPPFRRMLERYKPTGGAAADAQEIAQRKLENQLRRLGAIRHFARAQAAEDGTYDVQVRASDYALKGPYAATVRPLTRAGTDRTVSAGTPVDLSFLGLTKSEITAFVVITVRDVDAELTASCVVLAELEGDPTDRLDAVVAAQLDTPEKFMRFLYLLMNLGDPTAIEASSAGKGDGGFFGELGSGTGALELILRGLAINPAVISDLDRVVSAIRERVGGDAALPEGLAAIWPAVLEAQLRLTEHQS